MQGEFLQHVIETETGVATGGVTMKVQDKQLFDFDLHVIRFRFQAASIKDLISQFTAEPSCLLKVPSILTLEIFDGYRLQVSLGQLIRTFTKATDCSAEMQGQLTLLSGKGCLP